MSSLAEPAASSAGPGQRGPAEHERRQQIIKAADAHFRTYGYQKTSVQDLAKTIGVSSAYVYRFFESKQAIGEAVCAMVLGQIDGELHRIAAEVQPATHRLRQVYRCLIRRGLELLFNERKLHDIVVAAVENNWCTVSGHQAALYDAVHKIVADGRESGEFERKTPLDEVCRAIVDTLLPFAHPILLEQRNRETLEQSVIEVSNLVLRSLAP